MSSDEEKNAQQAALQEKVIEALHEDERINRFLYLGQEITEALIDDISFQERVTCVQMGLEQAIGQQDLTHTFKIMLACAQAKNVARDIPQEALQAIEEHAQAYNNGQYKPSFN